MNDQPPKDQSKKPRRRRRPRAQPGQAGAAPTSFSYAMLYALAVVKRQGNGHNAVKPPADHAAEPQIILPRGQKPQVDSEKD